MEQNDGAMIFPALPKIFCRKKILSVASVFSVAKLKVVIYQIILELSRRIVTGPKLTSSTSMRA